MKKILAFIACIVVFHIASATDRPGRAKGGTPCIKLASAPAMVYDACMDQYNQQTQLNEWMYSYMLYNCYEVFQFPYSTACHSEVILNWSSAQDVIFEQLMYCQNGNAGKTKSAKQ